MPELGKKHECAECGTKYYDLGKADAACPKCGSSQRETDKRSPAPEARVRYVPPPVAAPAAEEEEIPADDIVEEDDEILTVPGEEEEEEEEDDDEA
jgi:hypothetical protein